MEIESSDKFNKTFETAQQAVGGASQIAQKSGLISPDVLKALENVKDIVSGIKGIFDGLSSLRGSGGSQRAVSEDNRSFMNEEAYQKNMSLPNPSGTPQGASPSEPIKQPDVIVSYRISSLYEDLKKLLKSQTQIPLTTTLQQIIDDESIPQLLQMDVVQNQITGFLKNHSEVVFR